MKIKFALYSFVLLALLHNYCLYAEPIITFFMYPYPINSQMIEKLGNKLQKPGKIAKYTHAGLAYGTLVSGIFSTYAGYITTSDVNGQTTFPRKQAQTTVQILITTKVTPIVMTGNTLANWQLEEGTAAIMYTLAQKEDTDTQLSFWETQEATLPETGIIPLDAIVIFAKPKNVYIPRGITIAQESPNLVLPNMYIRKGVKNAQNALYVMNINHYFGPVKYLYQQKPTEYLRAVQ